MADEVAYHFDPVDIEAIRLTKRLSVGMRVRRLLDRREVLMALRRGQLQSQFPQLSAEEVNLKVLEEIECIN